MLTQMRTREIDPSFPALLPVDDRAQAQLVWARLQLTRRPDQQETWASMTMRLQMVFLADASTGVILASTECRHDL